MATIEPISFPHSGNGARFMPGRISEDNRIAFGSMRFSKHAAQTDIGFVAGIGIGPGQHKSADEKGVGFELNRGGKIVPVHANAKAETIKIRPYTPKGEKQARLYVDSLTFQKHGDIYRAVPLEEDSVFYWEVITGDMYEDGDRCAQLLQAGMFDHGSCAYFGVGSGEIVINAPADKKLLLDPNARVAPVKVAATGAELVDKDQGGLIGGRPMWRTLVWRCRYTPKECETVLVRQYNRFYQLVVKGGKGAYIPISQEEEVVTRFRERYERLVVAQKLLDLPIAA